MITSTTKFKADTQPELTGLGYKDNDHYMYNAGHKCWDTWHNVSSNWLLAPLPPSNVENWPSHAPKSVFNIAWGEGGLRDSQEVSETVLEQGEQYKKLFYTIEVIT